MIGALAFSDASKDQLFLMDPIRGYAYQHRLADGLMSRISKTTSPPRGFHVVMMPSNVLLMMVSSDDSTIAANWRRFLSNLRMVLSLATIDKPIMAFAESRMPEIVKDA